MKYFKLSLVFAVILVFIAACSQPAANTATNTANVNKPVASANTAPPVDELASAKKIYSEKCVKCHKEDGSGGEANFDGEKINVISYKSEKSMKHDDAKMIDYITNGDDEMPAYKKQLSETEIKDLVKLIRRDFQGPQLIAK
jgi:mono/diheme cytochrome c family protein